MIGYLIMFYLHLAIYFVPLVYDFVVRGGCNPNAYKNHSGERLGDCTEGMQKPRTIDEYVQAWHNQIWEYGYLGWFKGKDAYTKTKKFEDYPKSTLAVKHVIFRFELN